MRTAPKALVSEGVGRGYLRVAKGYLDFFGLLSSSGRPCLAMKARALSSFLMTKGSLL